MSARDRIASKWARPAVIRWVLPLAALLTLAGYFGAWIDHPVAGLIITGLDLGEYVKFLPAIRSGQMTIWREGFYLPIFAISLILSTFAFRRELSYGWPARAGLLTGSAIAALNMLPPAWTPARMISAEFRLQAIAIAISLAAIMLSPFLALLPRRAVGLVVIVLTLPALWFPLRAFLTIVPEIAGLYNQPQSPAWGPFLMLTGLLGLLGIGLLYLLGGRQPIESESQANITPAEITD